MFCKQCGHQSQEDFLFCPRCGAAAPAAPEPPIVEPQPAPNFEDVPVSVNPAAELFLRIIKDKLFQIICILMTVGVCASVFASSLPLISILLTVFLWLVYGQVESGTADHKNLRCVSGTLYAEYILTYVVAGLIALVGLIWGALWGTISGMADFQLGLQQGLSSAGVVPGTTEYDLAMQLLAGNFFTGIFLVAAALIAIYNLFTIRYLHCFVKSFYESIRDGQLVLKHVGAVKIVLIVLSVFSAIGALTSLGAFAYMSVISSGTQCAACILTYILIDRHVTA